MRKYGISAVYGHGETSSHKHPDEGKTISNLLRAGGLQRAENGGIFDGPGASFPSDSDRGKKLSPLKLDSLLMKLAKTGSESLNPAVSSSTSSATDNYAAEDQGAMNLELYNMIQHKLDNVLNALDSSYGTQSKILRHSMV